MNGLFVYNNFCFKYVLTIGYILNLPISKKVINIALYRYPQLGIQTMTFRYWHERINETFIFY